jgi:hypothetical protein
MEWSAFKERGVPNVASVSAFRDSFNAKLLQAQFGSRLGERAVKGTARLKRTNVLTLLEKFSKRMGCDVMGPYEWLRAHLRRVSPCMGHQDRAAKCPAGQITNLTVQLFGAARSTNVVTPL